MLTVDAYIITYICIYLDIGSTPHPAKVANKGLQSFFSTKNVVILVVTVTG